MLYTTRLSIYESPGDNHLKGLAPGKVGPKTPKPADFHGEITALASGNAGKNILPRILDRLAATPTPHKTSDTPAIRR
ncbi:MAG: uS11 family ribosomal protein [Planctomycetota bacterium]